MNAERGAATEPHAHRTGRLTGTEREAIRAATAAAEAQTHAEIVPYVVGRAWPGDEEAWQASALAAVILPAVAAAVWQFAGPWQTYPLVWLVVPAVVGAALGYVAGARVGSLARRLAGDAALDARTLARARSAFLEEALFHTRERTGILVFVALFEHRALILADEGINARVAPQEWQTIVDRLTAAIGRGAIADGLAEAIGACGQMVKERGGAPAAGDTNELPDEPRESET